MLTKPCLRGGTCHSSSSRKSYTCECPPPFYGDKCQFLDYDAYGLKGITAFDNSREGDHLLKLNCDFGPNAVDYEMIQIFDNGTTLVLAKGEFAEKPLVAPSRYDQINDTDNKSIVRCSANIKGIRGERVERGPRGVRDVRGEQVEDMKQIRFYDFKSYGV